MAERVGGYLFSDLRPTNDFTLIGMDDMRQQKDAWAITNKKRVAGGLTENSLCV
jgi:hypothetical protein